MYALRYLLAALMLPAFTLAARHQGAAPSGATNAATAVCATSPVRELVAMMARFAA